MAIKSTHLLFIVGALVLISQVAFRVPPSYAAEAENNSFQDASSDENKHERFLEEEAEASDETLEEEEQIYKSKQVFEPEDHSWSPDDYPPGEPDLLQDNAVAK